jgi:hypothetical protein
MMISSEIAFRVRQLASLLHYAMVERGQLTQYRVVVQVTSPGGFPVTGADATLELIPSTSIQGEGNRHPESGSEISQT